MDFEFFVGESEMEVEVEIEGGEWGNVEVFWGDFAKGVIGGGSGDEVGFDLTESVADLDDGVEWEACGSGAEVKGDGVKNVAEDARESDQLNFPIGGKDQVIFVEVGEEIFFYGGGFVAWKGEMIAVAKLVNIATIVAKKRQVFGEDVEFIEIEGEEENLVTKLVFLWGEAVVHDAALVDCGIHDQRGSPVMALAHSRALVKPSSWKPYLNQAPAK